MDGANTEGMMIENGWGFTCCNNKSMIQEIVIGVGKNCKEGCDNGVPENTTGSRQSERQPGDFKC